MAKAKCLPKAPQLFPTRDTGPSVQGAGLLPQAAGGPPDSGSTKGAHRQGSLKDGALGPESVRRSEQAGRGPEGARQNRQHVPVSTRARRRPPKLGSHLCISAPLPSAGQMPPPAPGPTWGAQLRAIALGACPVRHAVQRPSGPEPSAWQTRLSPHLPARPGPAPRASLLTPLSPSASGSGKAGHGQGSAGCDSSRAQPTLPQFLHLNNRKGPSVPGCGMRPGGCFPN